MLKSSNFGPRAVLQEIVDQGLLNRDSPEPFYQVLLEGLSAPMINRKWRSRADVHNWAEWWNACGRFNIGYRPAPPAVGILRVIPKCPSREAR